MILAFKKRCSLEARKALWQSFIFLTRVFRSIDLKKNLRNRLIAFFNKHEFKTDNRLLVVYFHSGRSEPDISGIQLRLS